MQNYQVPGIYIVEDHIKTDKVIARLERLLAKITSSQVEYISSSELPSLIEDKGWYKAVRTGKRNGNPAVIFSGFDWDDKFNDPYKIDDSRFEKGKVRIADFRNGDLLKARGISCNPGYELHVADGCFYSCSYCHVGDAVMIMLNLEESLARIDQLMDRRPEQKIFKCDNSTDLFTLEPEIGASSLLVEHFADTDRYLLLFSKSDNVDHLLDLDHKGRTVTGFTFSTDYCAGLYEPGTPTLDERIAAAKKCQEAGYHLRIRFSPIIPVEGWKEHSREMIQRVFSSLEPEVVSMEMLCHMDAEAMNRCLDHPKLDARFAEPSGKGYELFDPGLRAEVYSFFSEEMKKHNPKVRRTLCLETPKVWKDATGLTGNSSNFLCYCRGDKSPAERLVRVRKNKEKIIF